MSDNKYIKSPLNYVGGKYKILPKILPLFPDDIKMFVDLFCGGGNVGVNINAETIVLNDKEERIIELLQWFYKNNSDYLISYVENLIREYDLSNTYEFGYEYYNCNSSDGVAQINKENYKKLVNDYNNGRNYTGVLYTILVFAFNNQLRFNKQGKFNMPVNKRDFNKSIRNNLINFSNLMKNKNLKFTINDFRKLKIEKLTNKDFVYLDPPYYITTATYNENNGWTEKDEYDLYDLCDRLHNQGVRFALSNVTYHKGKQNDILIEWSKKYNIHNLNYSYGNSNYQTKDKSKNSSQEVLVTNY